MNEKVEEGYDTNTSESEKAFVKPAGESLALVHHFRWSGSELASDQEDGWWMAAWLWYGYVVPCLISSLTVLTPYMLYILTK